MTGEYPKLIQQVDFLKLKVSQVEAENASLKAMLWAIVKDSENTTRPGGTSTAFYVSNSAISEAGPLTIRPLRYVTALEALPRAQFDSEIVED